MTQVLYELGVIHGRFQVLHNDHLRYILAGKELCRHLVVGITNPDPTLTLSDPADPKRSLPESNPLTYYERYQLVTECLVEAGATRETFSVVPFPVNRPDLYRFYVPLEAVFFLSVYDDWGRRKLALFRGQGLACHVLWDRPAAEKGISGSAVREAMARSEPWKHLVPPAAARLLEQWQVPARLARPHAHR